MKKKLIALGVALLCIAAVAVALWQSGVFAPKTWQELTADALDRTAKYAVSETQALENIADDEAAMWAFMALCRSGVTLPEDYVDNYLTAMEAKLTACGGDLIGDSSKQNTEYSRMVLTLTAGGCDAADFAGFDMVAPLGDYEKTAGQGINGVAYALLAIDSGSYDCPVREDYIRALLEAQLPDGGWALGGFEVSDADVTASVLQALAKYQDRPEVQAAVEAGLTRLSQVQLDNGGYQSMGGENPETCAQVLLALVELGVDPMDERFIKNGNSALDAMLDYQISSGGFIHQRDMKEPMAITTYQCLQALVTLQRLENGAHPFYTMP